MTVKRESKSVQAQVQYVLKMCGPCSFASGGELHSWKGGAAIVRMTVMGPSVINQEIVAIVGSGTGEPACEMLNLREFLGAGGTIGVDL